MTDRADDPMWQFVDRHVTSFVKWDVLVYFYFSENPDEPQAPFPLAAQLARSEEDVRQACTEFAEEGLLTTVQGATGVSYKLNRDSELEPVAERFAISTQSREGRLQVLAHILQASTR